MGSRLSHDALKGGTASLRDRVWETVSGNETEEGLQAVGVMHTRAMREFDEYAPRFSSHQPATTNAPPRPSRRATLKRLRRSAGARGAGREVGHPAVSSSRRIGFFAELAST